MQFIQKQNSQPVDWDTWFTTATGRRSYDYGADNDSLTQLSNARNFLVNEQSGLCAYCQRKITLESSTIEHVIPKEFNKDLSTDYHNLVAVCIPKGKDENGKYHCDKSKLSQKILPIIFFSDALVTQQSNSIYFMCYPDGSVIAKSNNDINLKKQVEAFIEILNLNHKDLIKKRKDAWVALTDIYQAVPQYQREKFWKNQFENILINQSKEYRQFLLIYLGSKKIGIN
ncbi:MAG: hypothetical protein RL065_2073 [Bacteroidota bacterium]|jgi:uncharacterized protein (TIGR02646 family)